MDVWHIALYAFGGFVALRVLAQLMQRHRRYYLQELTKEYYEKSQPTSTPEETASVPTDKKAA